ncbi:MAG: prepilin-type N-terminal cleavage/methylation domain-containing protein [Verrucomicrobiota bacterium]
MHPSTKPRPPLSKQTREAGFTLAEVAIAMAIFSFALVSMLGMLSVGLKTSRKASLQTAASNLMSTIAADIQASLKIDTEDTSTFLHSYTFKTPTLGLEASYNEENSAITVTPATMTLTDAATDASALSIRDQGSLKLFKVTFSAPNQDPTLSQQIPVGIRVKVSWPFNIPPTATPEGYVESIIPLPVH